MPVVSSVAIIHDGRVSDPAIFARAFSEVIEPFLANFAPPPSQPPSYPASFSHSQIAPLPCHSCSLFTTWQHSAASNYVYARCRDRLERLSTKTYSWMPTTRDVTERIQPRGHSGRWILLLGWASLAAGSTVQRATTTSKTTVTIPAPLALATSTIHVATVTQTQTQTVSAATTSTSSVSPVSTVVPSDYSMPLAYE